MREIRQSGSVGGVGRKPYPYLNQGPNSWQQSIFPFPTYSLTAYSLNNLNSNSAFTLCLCHFVPLCLFR